MTFKITLKTDGTPDIYKSLEHHMDFLMDFPEYSDVEVSDISVDESIPNTVTVTGYCSKEFGINTEGWSGIESYTISFADGD